MTDKCIDGVKPIWDELSELGAEAAAKGAFDQATTPMCERKTNMIEREGYRKTGYVLMKDDPSARICVSDQGAVSWFTKDEWHWLMHNRDHVEFQWPKPIGAQVTPAVKKARKIGGSYQAIGTIVAEFKADDGSPRYVFRFDNPSGLLHIFTGAQIEIEKERV